MANKFVTSDLHLFHENIIKYCERPFANNEEMNQALIQNWNKVVSQDDEVYVLGDFALIRGNDNAEKHKQLSYVTRSLNGKKHLLFGNHDYFSDENYIEAGFESVHHGLLEILLNDHWFTLCHYQMTSWNNSHRGSMHLFGHEHWRQQYEPKHSVYEEIGWSEKKFNVCADANKFTPININDIIRILDKRPTNFKKRKDER